MDCFEERKLKVVTNKLKGSATAYLKYLKNKEALSGKPPITAWEKLKNYKNMQISRFQGGLKREMKDQMKMLNSFTLGQAFDLANRLSLDSLPCKFNN
ncbi:hypothetical protein ACOSQ2_003750 [Xanthoceras sorbifolium]